MRNMIGQVDKFISALQLVIDQPFPPLLVVHKVEADRMVVTWRVEAYLKRKKEHKSSIRSAS